MLAAQWLEAKEAASSPPSPLPILSEHKFYSTLNKTCAKQRSPISPPDAKKGRFTVMLQRSCLSERRDLSRPEGLNPAER